MGLRRPHALSVVAVVLTAAAPLAACDANKGDANMGGVNGGA